MVGGNSTGERLARLEEFVGTPLSTEEICLANQIQVLRDDLREFKETIAAFMATSDGKFTDLFAIMGTSSENVRDQLRTMGNDIAVMKGAVASNLVGGSRGDHFNVKIPEPKSYGGARVGSGEFLVGYGAIF